jgi:hypothetical protein
MAARPFLAISLWFISAAAAAAPPQLYRLAGYESPARADPDDLLLLAGYGFAADDTVVYRAIRDTTAPLTAPEGMPAASGEESGVAAVVSSADVPYSLTIKMPRAARIDQSYALWVHTAHGEWSTAIKINDARPLWISPAVVYASGMPAFLPRELKVVGRNLRPSLGRSTLVRLAGPQRFTGAAASAGPSAVLGDYVARVPLPAHLAPGQYRVTVSRDGVSWVDLEDQMLDVLPDPPAAAEFSVSDAQYGGCRPDDGIDDTPCILRAVAAAGVGGGTVYFGPGSWDVTDGGQAGLTPTEGIVVPIGVRLRGAGSALTRLQRHREWSSQAANAAFTLVGHNLVSGFTFRDLQVYQPGDHAAPYLQLGENWQRVSSAPNASTDGAVVRDVIISQNTFDKPDIAIGVGGLPIDRLFITHNVFGAYGSALELNGDQYDMAYKFRLDDSVIDYNVFMPSSKLDLVGETGTLASEVGAGYRVDFSGNSADGTSTDFLYSPQDATGWRAAFFWNPTANVEKVLVSQNTATCTGDKIGDGEAISFDNNTNTFGFASAPTLVGATSSSVTVSAPLATRQNSRDVPIATYYVGHWLQIVSGPGVGQVRKITGYSRDLVTRQTRIAVAPAWDVVPAAGKSRISVGREYWQLYVVDNQVDNRAPLCKKSNRSRPAAGSIEIWGQSADSVLAGNRQYDSDGILVQQNYGAPEHTCADCAMMGFFNYFLEIRDNIVDGEYDWNNDCSHSGIAVGVAAAPWEASAPPTVGFGVSISHNVVRHADAQGGGAISQLSTWFAGPEPHRWPLSDNLLIHHNAIADIEGPRALAVCGSTSPRTGIAFPDPAIAWHTVLYANSCDKVSLPVGAGGVDTVKVCPTSAANSCECPSGK